MGTTQKQRRLATAAVAPRASTSPELRAWLKDAMQIFYPHEIAEALASICREEGEGATDTNDGLRWLSVAAAFERAAKGTRHNGRLRAQAVP